MKLEELIGKLVECEVASARNQVADGFKKEAKRADKALPKIYRELEQAGLNIMEIQKFSGWGDLDIEIFQKELHK
ncbi:hypothetical protein [Listeria innocua]|uniref:hypothetical protein n=1 Tax=Listeria innocua TaxID=1642 RepID=UPI0016279752|nr:hypothetical protein [Listeria innocua]MBC1925549.1 hypothetical protein [Listeria innocua]